MNAWERSERARIAALVRWSKEDPTANGVRGQAGLMAKFEREVDPEGVLPERERQRRAEAARRAHMLRMAARSRELRAAKKAASVAGPFMRGGGS